MSKRWGILELYPKVGSPKSENIVLFIYTLNNKISDIIEFSLSFDV